MRDDETIRTLQQPPDPDDCATMVVHEVAEPNERPSPLKRGVQALERRIKTIDRVIDALKK